MVGLKFGLILMVFFYFGCRGGPYGSFVVLKIQLRFFWTIGKIYNPVLAIVSIDP